MFKLDRQPEAFIEDGPNLICLAAFTDLAPPGSLSRGRDGGYARGLLFVGVRRDTLEVVWTEGVRTTATSDDARAHPEMLPQYRALFDGRPGSMPFIVE